MKKHAACIFAFGTAKPRDLGSLPRTTTGRSPGSHLPYQTAFPCKQWHKWNDTGAYSDEIAQAFHLFPYSPQNPLRHQSHDSVPCTDTLLRRNIT